MIFVKISQLQELLAQSSYPASEREQQELIEHCISLGIDPNGYYQEMEMSSRYVDTHRDVSFSNATIALHSHTFYELLCCQGGEVLEYLLGTERYRIQRGDIIIVPPGVSHRPIFPPNMPEPYRRDVVWLSQEFLSSLQEVSPGLPGNGLVELRLLRTAGTPWEHLPELFHQGVLEQEAGQPGWKLAVLGNTITLVVQLGRALRDKDALPLQAEQPELLEQVMAYVERHLAEKITLGDIARHFYVSESTISHLFQQKMGVSFYRCVTQRRLVEAKTRIWAGESLESVANGVGFSDYSTFYRAFKREYGVSPRQIRLLK